MNDVRAIPVRGIPEIRPGDDLVVILMDAIRAGGLSLGAGDVVAVTQKVVSKAEGRVVPEGPGGRDEWVALETRRVVARRDDLVVAETRHGFVCANAGVDASNVEEGFLTLLPEDPDASAERIRAGLSASFGVRIGVVITDTFGRAWRRGVVNVAIGCAGLPSLVDLRGTKDAGGRVLEATIVALADEVAAASGLAMGKADGVPVAILRGVRAEDPPLPASQIIRPRGEDLFRESPLQAIHARESVRSFGPGEVPEAALREAIAAACAAPAPGDTRPWLFVALRPGPSRMRLLAAMAEPADSPLAEAPVLIVPLAEGSAADRETLLLWGGAAIQSLLLALHAQGLASNWTPSTVFHPNETREALGLGQEWIPLGSVAVGPAPAEGPTGRPRIDPSEFLREA